MHHVVTSDAAEPGGRGERDLESMADSVESQRTEPTPAHGATLGIAVLPFPVLKVDRAGSIVESNGLLERERSLPPSGEARALREITDADFASAVMHAVDLGDAATLPTVQLAPVDPAAPARTFTLVRDGAALWLVGQPLECDVQRAALEQRAQALLDASDAKARFLATMSHELRTPLNAVLGYAGLLRDGVYGTITDAQERAVRSIVRRARDLQLLIDDVLDLSKIEGGRAELRVDEFDPSVVLDEVKDAIMAYAREKGLTVAVRTNLHAAVRLDRVKYKQAVLNLATNAVKFTPPRGEVELSLQAHDEHHFITRVRDTGIGIAPEDIHRIFDSFQQVDTGSTRRYPGIGLGLTIVQRIVELLGGSVAVESEPGHGTSFLMTLPTRPESDTILGDSGAIPADAELSDDPVVVAIDDDPEVIALLRDSLAPAHFRVVGALSGDRGRELARILHPLAITLDIMMPDKDGWQVLREIKADPELAAIPVIALSIVSERALGISLGVTEYLVKPVDRQVLIGVLDRLRARPTMHSALVVDDDEDARTLMHDLLSSLGFEARVAATGAEAIETLGQRVPEVLFVDAGLPRADVSALLDLLARDSRYARLRVVVVTRRGDSSAREEWLRRAAAAAVVYRGHEHPAELLNELRVALAEIGTETGVGAAT